MPIIDRFEGDMALWEGGSAPRAQLPPEAKEGDFIREDGAGGYFLDRAAGEDRRRALANRLAALFQSQKEREE